MYDLPQGLRLCCCYLCHFFNWGNKIFNIQKEIYNGEEAKFKEKVP